MLTFSARATPPSFQTGLGAGRPGAGPPGEPRNQETCENTGILGNFGEFIRNFGKFWGILGIYKEF